MFRARKQRSASDISRGRVLVVSGGSEEILMDMVAKQQRKLAQL